MAPVIFWFRRDLRLADHPALGAAAALAGDEGVIPLFVLDDALLGPAGPARAHFLASSLAALEQSMAAPLCLRAGDPVDVVPALAEETGATVVVATRDHAPYGCGRDRQVAERLVALGLELRLVSSNYAVAPGAVRSEKGEPFKVFTAYRRRWEAMGPHAVAPPPQITWSQAPSQASMSDLIERASKVRPLLFGDLPDGPPSTLPVAGEAAATAALASFAADGAAAYRDRRDLLAIPGTSSLSPHLRFGSVHPRTVLAAVSGADEGAATFRSEICWREFYADVLAVAPHSVTESLQPALRGLRWDEGPVAEERFRTWARGETGVPLVDASMRQLLATGWMHNRGRMVAASFLVKHLHLDWRWGARWFMWRLVDGDLASNTHGWQWAAGTGTDAAPFHRIFSPLAQAQRFDARGDYIHRWVPELREIPAPAVLAPGGGVDLLHPADYPPAMVDLTAERAEALARFAEARDAHRGDP